MLVPLDAGMGCFSFVFGGAARLALLAGRAARWFQVPYKSPKLFFVLYR